jgi:hypothetical protein
MIIGTGRIGLAMIWAALRFRHEHPLLRPAYHNDKYIASIQLMDLRLARGIQKEDIYWGNGSRRASRRLLSIHVPLLREGETDKPTYHSLTKTLANEADSVSGE